ncbi:MAG: indole-3-glycerol phosphate synthase TrpC [Chloroflexota bacterium]
MSTFVQTDTVLDRILAHKVTEIAKARKLTPMAKMAQAAQVAKPPLDVMAALRRETVALIAEVKHASPSRGVLIEPFEPVALATTYAECGAAMLSVLTDEQFFKGHLDYLRQIRRVVNIPLLRKEFVIDGYQVYEARAAGADAVLLIVAALDDAQLADLHSTITGLGMAALVEVHSEPELERAMKAGATLLGINNRDLKTFDVDLQTTARLAARVPDDVTLVAESGMKTAADVGMMGERGAHAVLIGEGLVTSDNIAAAVKIFSSVERGA